ncbi:MAG: alanine--glyoxylate aminotransferase family protein [Firmicutes bacterium]|nr:alanine--glyoxylate aminotransferase family protein [Bacillota bacterium]
MLDKKYLYTPGPTPIPPQVTAAMARPMIGHRGQEFAGLHGEIVEKAKVIFQTTNDLYVLTTSGTGGLETAIANTVTPGDRVLALVTGNFGERFAKLASTYGGLVTKLEFPWGTTINMEQVDEVWKAKGPFKLVLATHNETSTGVTNDIAALGEYFANTESLLLVDAVSSMGAMDIRTDEWHVDIMVTGSQKALMLPPGLALISVSPKAWPIIEANSGVRFYFSLLEARKSFDQCNTPWTPAVALFYGLDAALDLILAEGLDNVFQRHARMAAAVRAGARALGLGLLADDSVASHTVTAVLPDLDIGTDTLSKILQEDMGVMFAGGQGQLRGRLLRIGHMGYCSELDVLMAIAALEMALYKAGIAIDLGAGVKAAEALLCIPEA